ncbi:ParA family protein [Schinkia azotoformans]|uniref:AAA family ATPase n=1 Tax=Schinkia azotoformans TaxID=1454 RepID=UPI002E224D9F|nr:ParA family protein [Schinkia azotoformans]
MLSEAKEIIFSTFVLKGIQADVEFSHERLLEKIQENGPSVVYILWPEEKQLLNNLGECKVFGVGDPNNRNEYKEAIRSGLEDLLDRQDFVLDEEHDDFEEEDQIIYLTPQKRNTPHPFQDLKISENTFSRKENLQYINFNELHIQPLGGRQTFCVTSTKGGVGKTTISSNLAFSLANFKQSRVCLVDFMQPHGNITTRFRINSNLSPLSWERYRKNSAILTDRQILSELVIRHPSNNLYILPGVNLGENVSVELGKYILSNLVQVFDYVVIDVGPEDMELQMQAMLMANKTLLVVDYDIATIYDTQIYIQQWNKRKLLLDKINIVVNFESARRDKKNPITREKCKQYFSGMDIVAFMPEVEGMRGIHNEGKVITENAAHPFTQQIDKMVQQFIPDYKRVSKIGFLQRLFGSRDQNE